MGGSTGATTDEGTRDGPIRAPRAMIGAALVLLADDGDDIVTSDPQGIEPLAALAGRHVELLQA